MINLVRPGSEIVLMETLKHEYLLKQLEQNFEIVKHGDSKVLTLSETCTTADETMVQVFLTKKLKETATFDDAYYTIILKEELQNILTFVINELQCGIVNKVRVAPDMIMMKVIGDSEKMMNLVQSDLKGEFGNFQDHLNNYNRGAVICFTESSLHHPVGFGSILEKGIYCDNKYRYVINFLRSQHLKYVNAGMVDDQWTEFKIKIYDAYGNYDLHYKKLKYILERLDCGFILDEAWGTDAATIFWSVGVYVVRFFTYKTAKELKAILFGLEYMEDGTRLVDYDLFKSRKKIHWDVLMQKEYPKKVLLQTKMRKDLLEMLSPEEIEQLNAMEEHILASTKK